MNDRHNRRGAMRAQCQCHAPARARGEAGGPRRALTRLRPALRAPQALARMCVEKGITKIAFDRGGYKYHGRVAALADAAREAGLDF